MSSIVGVCFDATGTLIEMTESVGTVYRRVALDFGVDLPAWRLDDAFQRVLRGAPRRGIEGETRAAREVNEIEWWRERVRQTFQATDSTVRFEDFAAFSRSLFEIYRTVDLWRLRPGARTLLEALAESRVPLGLLSNFDHRLPDILQGLEIKDFFDFILIPSVHGERKPDRAAFARAAGVFGCGLEGVLYVGDDSAERLECIAGLGVQVIPVEADQSAADLAATIRSQLGRAADRVRIDP